eukprot:15034446-Alexandrium_andersonii.AAC.1
MSASLVGSEMCIRDRRVHSGGSTALPAPQAGSSSFEWFRAVSYAPCPVSYTHLTLPTICSV